LIGISLHDEVLGSDIVTSLHLNYEWRRIVSQALQAYFDRLFPFVSDSDIDIPRNNLQGLLNDLYTVDPGGTVAATLKEAWRTTTQALQNANVVHVLAFEAGDYDATNTDRLYVPHAGLQTVTFNARLFSNGASATAQVLIVLNNTTVIAHAVEILDSNETTLWVSLTAQVETDENAFFNVQTVSSLANRVEVGLVLPKLSLIAIEVP
jgi:hypothetical protein